MRAVVTQKPLGRAMMRQCDAAVGTDHNIAAVIALNERRVAAAVQQKNALLSTQQSRSKSAVQLFADHRLVRSTNARIGVGSRTVPEIHYIDSGQPAAAYTIWQSEQRILPGGSVGPGFDRRRRAAQNDDRALEP